MFGPLILLVAAVALMRWQPDLPFSRLLQEWCARRPVQWLLRRTRHEVIGWAIAAVLLTLGGEAVIVLGGPHAVLAFAVELAVYVDVVIAAATLTSVARIRSFGQRLRIVRVRGAKPRTPRSLRPRPLKPGNDNADEDRPAAMAA